MFYLFILNTTLSEKKIVQKNFKMFTNVQKSLKGLHLAIFFFSFKLTFYA